MANRLKTDELNIYDSKASSKSRAIPYEKYFGEMDLTDDEKEIRIALAEKLEQVFLFLFTMIGIEIAIGNEVEVAYYYAMVERKLNDALEEDNIDKDEYPLLAPHISELAQEVVDTTVKNISQTNDQNQVAGTTTSTTSSANNASNPDSYFTSDDRAMFIAENEANAVRNLIQLENAIKAGYTKKKWVTMRDKKVRHTHMLVDGETIGIYDAFEVGDSLLMFPKDTSMDADAREIVGCRCVCKYRK